MYEIPCLIMSGLKLVFYFLHPVCIDCGFRFCRFVFWWNSCAWTSVTLCVYVVFVLLLWFISFCLFILPYSYMLVFVLSYHVTFYLLHYCPLDFSLFSNDRQRRGRSGWEWWWEETERIRKRRKSHQDILFQKKYLLSV